jgi:hypothetical protein
MHENVGASTSRNPKGLHGLYTDSFTFIIILIVIALHSFIWPWLLVQFLILYTVGRAPWEGDKHVTGPLPSHRTTQTSKNLTRASLS